MDSRNTHLLLFSIVFLLLGFLLGRVTAPKHPHPRHGKRGGMKWIERGIGDAHELDVRVLTEEEFEGDTAITLPGVGKVNVTINGEEVEVETDQIEALHAGGHAVIVTKEVAGDSIIRMEKRVMVVTSED